MSRTLKKRRKKILQYDCSTNNYIRKRRTIWDKEENARNEIYQKYKKGAQSWIGLRVRLPRGYIQNLNNERITEHLIIRKEQTEKMGVRKLPLRAIKYWKKKFTATEKSMGFQVGHIKIIATVSILKI